MRLWAMVTVASTPLRASSNDKGKPTNIERPTTTARRPDVATPYLSSKRMTPNGVQPTNPGRPRTKRPIDSLVRPSTSLSAGIKLSTASSS